MKQRIMDDLKQAMRDKDALAKATLQVLKARLDSLEKDKGAELTSEEQIAAVQTEIKQTTQTLEAAEKAGHSTLYEQEASRIKFLEQYLPKQLTEEEARKILVQAELAGLSMKDAMTKAKQLLSGQVPNALIAKLVKALI